MDVQLGYHVAECADIQLVRLEHMQQDTFGLGDLVDQQLALLFVQVGDLGEVLGGGDQDQPGVLGVVHQLHEAKLHATDRQRVAAQLDRKSTRLNSSH